VARGGGGVSVHVAQKVRLRRDHLELALLPAPRGPLGAEHAAVDRLERVAAGAQRLDELSVQSLREAVVGCGVAVAEVDHRPEVNVGEDVAHPGECLHLEAGARLHVARASARHRVDVDVGAAILLVLAARRTLVVRVEVEDVRLLPPLRRRRRRPSLPRPLLRRHLRRRADLVDHLARELDRFAALHLRGRVAK
jgi:hypothetical protein